MSNTPGSTEDAEDARKLLNANDDAGDGWTLLGTDADADVVVSASNTPVPVTPTAAVDPTDIEGLRRRRLQAFGDGGPGSGLKPVVDDEATTVANKVVTDDIPSGNSDDTPLNASVPTDPPATSTQDQDTTPGAFPPSSTSASDTIPESSTTPAANTSDSPSATPPPPSSQSKDDDASQPQPPPPHGEEKMCRICFGGAEDEEQLGRLISPCRCKGTMKHVHITCLNEWRARRVKPESYFQCDQCHYKYHFSRTQWAKVFQNELIVTGLTLLAFFVTVLVAGFISKLLILYVLYDPDDPILMAPPSDPPAIPNPITGALPGQPAAAAQSPDDDQPDLIDHLLDYLHPSRIRLWAVDLSHMLSGVLLVGVMGCFSMLYYLVMNPLGFHLQFGGTGGLGRRGARDDMSALVVVVLVAVGVFRAVFAIWKGVRYLCRQSLRAVEDRILEVEEEQGPAAVPAQ
ncbi:hypothetical protein HDU96_008691 [Phlyctochytrium bullatum]|nr:hypothetical protein HDU96_008691 [Phlyctochytrium bullatum]